MTSTLGKALGGASGGFTSGHRAIIELLRQRSRPYLFSNTLAPMIAYTSIQVLDMIQQSSEFRDRLMANTHYFRQQMIEQGFQLKAGVHPITPIMLYEAKLAQNIAQDLLEQGIYVIGFSHPVVPEGQARIRVQVSAAHTRSQLDQCVAAFAHVGRKYNIIPAAQTESLR
jgi:glycine C-acetyltransferase